MGRAPTSESKASLIVIFAKYPTPNRVKTRLIGRVSPEQAAGIHDACLRHTLSIALSVGDSTVWLAHAPDDSDFSGYQSTDVTLRPQGSGDLGERLTRTCREAFEEGYTNVAFVGCDCPTLSPADLRTAFGALVRDDVAIGPAADGGYYLLATRRFEPTLFAEIDWGSSHVCAQTLARAEAADLGVTILGQRSDLDTPEDLDAFLAARAPTPAVESLRMTIEVIVNEGGSRATD